MNKTYIPALIAVALMAFLHHIGGVYNLYTAHIGYDVMMHILGGIGLACSIYWFIVSFIKKTPSFWTVVLLTFIAGFFWEGFEAYYDIAGATVGTKAYYIDTVKDLFDDTVGAIVSAYFIFKK